MASFSLTEKLAATGAFLALVAMMVGTEDDPGLVVTGQDAVTALRPAAVMPPPLAPDALPTGSTAHSAEPQPSHEEVPSPAIPATATQHPDNDAADKQFDPELGRVPLDFSNGPPPG